MGYLLDTGFKGNVSVRLHFFKTIRLPNLRFKKIPQKIASTLVQCSCNKHSNTIIDANAFTIERFEALANKFSGILGNGLDKPTQRIIKELIYAILADKDVKISRVAGSLQEDIALKRQRNVSVVIYLIGLQLFILYKNKLRKRTKEL
jgi:hypothetical protein